jgi:hypothetical protein
MLIRLFALKVAVERVALLLHILEGLDSNLGPETDYLEVFMVFLSPSKQMPIQDLKLGHARFLPYHYSQIIVP